MVRTSGRLAAGAWAGAIYREGAKGKYTDMVEFYAMRNVFYLPEQARWSTVVQYAKQDDIALRVDTALSTVEKNNSSSPANSASLT